MTSASNRVQPKLLPKARFELKLPGEGDFELLESEPTTATGAARQTMTAHRQVKVAAKA